MAGSLVWSDLSVSQLQSLEGKLYSEEGIALLAEFSAEVLKTRLGYLFLLKSAEDGSVLYQSDSVAEWQQVGSNPRSQVVFLSAAGKSEDGKKLYNIHPAGDSDWSMNQFFCLGVGQGNGQDEEGKPEGHNFAYVRCNLDDMSQRFALDFGGTSAGDSARVRLKGHRRRKLKQQHRPLLKSIFVTRLMTFNVPRQRPCVLHSKSKPVLLSRKQRIFFSVLHLSSFGPRVCLSWTTAGRFLRREMTTRMLMIMMLA
eukprot:tig00000852_g5055.t1